MDSGLNYTYQGFAYDTDVECEPYLNIDTDGDNRPDINLDLDGDGKPDINIDVDGDRIPDTNIDSRGDGKPDINVDTDNDGNPDENIVEITEWKPEHNVDKPFSYDTMKIESRPKLEDQGVIIEKPDGGKFLPNMALKVIDVTAEKKEAVTSNAADFIKEGQEVKQVFDIKLLENGIEVKPDGILKIRIPIANDIKNPTLIKQRADGSYEKINAIIEDGYLVYESDELGIVSIIGDLSSEIQGNYYPGDHTGGALTGDHTNIMLHVSVMCFSIAILYYLRFKGKRITKR